ncbi:GNAT family N-acetyltransferase [Chitinophaga solisilvae]|uniref:GNAT family N-acetyltransferase n=1 Tax=Chitinophaga solisilvae TaxID=1233460 RepID=UPI00136915BB|nr:GNAT family N-acetyltransferase [Chitinophaga solisilvae]
MRTLKSPIARSSICQPVTGNTPEPAFFFKEFPAKGFTVSLRPLCLATDLPLIHHWVNLPYARRFWQMNMSREQLSDIYTRIQSGDIATSYLCLLNDHPVSQIEIYQAQYDEISRCYEAQPGDYGIHLLMAPKRSTISGLTISVFTACLEFMFSFPEIRRIIGEPDIENERANRLVQKAGFVWQQAVTMSYKRANLYYCTRETLQHI